MSRIPALVEPELLRWARRSAGFQLGEAAHKIQVKPERLESWERNEAKPTVIKRGLRRMRRSALRARSGSSLPFVSIDSVLRETQ